MSESNKEDTSTDTTYTVKKSLQSLLSDESLLRRINHAVYQLTWMGVEMSKLCNLHMIRIITSNGQIPYPTKIDQSFFYFATSLVSRLNQKNHTTAPKDTVDCEWLRDTYQSLYLRWRNFSISHSKDKTAVEYPIRKGMTQAMNYLGKEYLINCRNGVMMNFEARTKRYLRLQLDYLVVGMQEPVIMTKTTTKHDEKHKAKSKSNSKAAVVLTGEQIHQTIEKMYRDIAYAEEEDVLAKHNSHDRYIGGYHKDFSTYGAYLDRCLYELVIDSRRMITRQSPDTLPITDQKMQRLWQMYLPWFYHILQTFEKHNNSKEMRKKRSIRTFTLLPDRSWHPIHMTIDSRVLEILSSNGKRDNPRQSHKRKRSPFDGGDEEEEISPKDSLWQKYFTFPIKLWRQFAYFIKTDGRSCCVVLHRSLEISAKTTSKKGRKSKRQKREAKQEQNAKSIESLLKKFPYDHLSSSSSSTSKHVLGVEDRRIERIVGIDPGRRDFFVGAVWERRLHGSEKKIEKQDKYETISCSTREYYHMVGFKKAAKKRRQWIAQDPIIVSVQKEIPTCKTGQLAKWQLHLAYLFTKLRRLLDFYHVPKWRRLKFQMHIRKQQTWDKLIPRITNGDPDTVVALGDASFSSSSPGHAAGPVKTLQRELRKRKIPVVLIDEYNTSKKCSICLNDLEPAHFTGYNTRYQKPFMRREIYAVRVCHHFAHHKSIDGKADTNKSKNSSEKQEMKNDRKNKPGCRQHGRTYQQTKMFWNRDENASRTILHLFQETVLCHQDRPAVFRPPKKRS